jgi:hypothetical protein
MYDKYFDVYELFFIFEAYFNGLIHWNRVLEIKTM